MLLSLETLQVNSFVECTTYLFQKPGVKFILSESFCQDPFEAFFGKQRYKGGRNDNPSSKEYLDNSHLKDGDALPKCKSSSQCSCLQMSADRMFQYN
ncbi:hypothetical protein EMCRGX_G015282 [Ephydatia muelleri]